MKTHLFKIKRLTREVYFLFFITNLVTFGRYAWAIVNSLPAIFKVKNLGPAYARMEGRDYTFTVFGKSVTLNGKYFGRVTELYARGVYFSLPEFKLRDEMEVIVDLGANTGTFAVLAAKFAKKVIAVEADRRLLNELIENAKKNNVTERIKSVWGLVGAESGMFADPLIKEKVLGGDTPPFLSFGQILEENGVEWVDFLKIDIEGSEFDLFEKEMDSFSIVKYIAMEVHTPFIVHGIEVPAGDINRLRRLFEQVGFRVWLVDVNQKVVGEIKGQAGYLFAKNLKFGDNKKT